MSPHARTSIYAIYIRAARVSLLLGGGVSPAAYARFSNRQLTSTRPDEAPSVAVGACRSEAARLPASPIDVQGHTLHVCPRQSVNAEPALQREPPCKRLPKTAPVSWPHRPQRPSAHWAHLARP